MFVVFNKIIKDPDFFILDDIIRNINLYGEYFDLDKLQYVPPTVRYGLSVSRPEKNLLKWLMKKDCDWQTTYNLLYDNEQFLYINSPFLDMAPRLLNVANSYVIEEIYIWNEVFDKRQAFELSAMYPSNIDKNILYITGDYDKAIKSINNLRAVFDYDIDRLIGLIEERDDIIFGVANYGFNYKSTENDYSLKYNADAYKNVGTFSAYTVKDNQFFG